MIRVPCQEKGTPVDRLAGLIDKAGIGHATLHDLRRSFSTLAQRAGIDRHTVKDLGGWSTVGVVEKHYTGEVPDRLREAMSKLDEHRERDDLPAGDVEAQRNVS